MSKTIGKFQSGGKATPAQTAANKKKQQLLNQRGYNVKVDGSWGPWQDEQYKKIIWEQRPWYQRALNKAKKVVNRATWKTPVTASGSYTPAPVVAKAAEAIQNISKSSPQDENIGHAIYLHYPNFVGRASNAIKIGKVDLGKAVGDPDLPVGHAATILVSPQGESTYYEYGRYANQGFGHVRQTIKGGNWKKIQLPKQEKGENDSIYIARIQNRLPDTDTGPYQAMTIPNIDTQKAAEWINKEANNANRPRYNITNTCADGACNAIFPFQTKPEFHPLQIINSKGYSNASKIWSLIPFLSTGAHARTARSRASRVYVMNQ